MYTVESDNSNTQHHLSCFTRRTKIVSPSEEMVAISLKLWLALTSPAPFASLPYIVLSIYK